MMERAVVYHWWSQRPCAAWDDVWNPVVYSIAILRGHEPEVPIFVLDCSGHANDWGEFPTALRFEVVPTAWGIPRVRAARGTSGCFYRLCSRITSIPRFTAQRGIEEFLYTDSDVFWVRSPYPLDGDTDRLCCAQQNTGVFYGQSSAPRVRACFARWQETIARMLVDRVFAKEVLANYGLEALQDEAAFNWIYGPGGCSQWIDVIPRRENNHALSDAVPCPDAKNLHLVSVWCLGQPRAGFAVWIREFWEAMGRSLPDHLLVLLRRRFEPGDIGVADLNRETYPFLLSRSIKLG